MRRVLDKWEAVVEWYKIRADRVIQERRAPPAFPLENCHSELVQALSLLAPVADLKFKCQAERPEQVEVLMSLYMIRIDNLCPNQPILHYLSTDEAPQWIPASSLTPLAAKTRDLLREALDERFFARYYNDSAFDKCDFVLEMMLKLHPIYKNTQESLNRAVVLCCRQHGLKGKETVNRLNAVNDKIRSNLLSLLKKVAGPLDGVAGHVNASSPQLSRLEARLAPRTRPAVVPRVDKRAEDELDRWLEDTVDVERNANMAAK
ncbi:hypothetical protein DVH05_013812 [Phytophthora capsici]|nr:hypothetical protein DVH05_013812 [Phytophthora capsici]